MLKLLVLAVAISAAKDPSAKEAERLAKKSIVEYNVGDFESALEDATEAYKLDPLPGLLFNLGQCHRALHNWEKAEFFYRGYLREKPSATNRPAVEDLIKEMAQKQKEAAFLSPPAPEISSAPPAQVTVLEAPPTVSPAPLNLSPDTGKMSVEPAVEGQPPPPDHSRIPAYLLLGTAAAGAVLAGVSGGVLLDYQSYRNGLGSVNGQPATGTSTYSQFENKSSTAQIFNVLLYVGIGVAAGGLGGAVFTW